MSYNRFDNFKARVAGDRQWNPATSNLFGINILIPNATFLAKIGISGSELDESLNFLAQEVTLPSRQLTTMETRTFGTMIRHVSGTTFSEITMSFLLTKDMWCRLFFERWMNYITDDASSFVMIPADYKAILRISKWENGSNVILRRKNSEGRVVGSTRMKTCTGNWMLEGAFPFNISTMTLNNEETTLLKTDVSFYYDRYRFDNVGSGSISGLKGDDKYVDDINSLDTLVGSWNSQLGATLGNLQYE